MQKFLEQLRAMLSAITLRGQTRPMRTTIQASPYLQLAQDETKAFPASDRIDLLITVTDSASTGTYVQIQDENKKPIMTIRALGGTPVSRVLQYSGRFYVKSLTDAEIDDYGGGSGGYAGVEVAETFVAK